MEFRVRCILLRVSKTETETIILSREQKYNAFKATQTFTKERLWYQTDERLKLLHLFDDDFIFYADIDGFIEIWNGEDIHCLAFSRKLIENWYSGVPTKSLNGDGLIVVAWMHALLHIHTIVPSGMWIGIGSIHNEDPFVWFSTVKYMCIHLSRWYLNCFSYYAWNVSLNFVRKLFLLFII